MAGPEKNFENKIKKFLNDAGCYYVKFFANRMTRSGIPDLICCVNGFSVWVEVKAEAGRPSELQKWNIREIRKAGGSAMILYPDQFEDFKELVLELKRKRSIFEMLKNWITRVYD